MPKYKHLFLTGMMGCGKSTIGELLARQSGRKFIDLDCLIEENTGKSINLIFDEIGEEGFRKLEEETLLNLDLKSPTVVATGGGAVISKKNRLFMKEKGAIIYIETKPETIAKRLMNDLSRPLLKQGNLKNKLQTLLKERKSYYNDNTFKIDSNRLTPLQVSRAIIKLLKS